MSSTGGGLMLSLVIGGLAVLLYLQLKEIFFDVPPIPEVEEKWWGPGNPTERVDGIRSFKINVSDEVLKDLQQRLTHALPFQEPLEDAKQHYGINTKYLNTVVEFWKTKYNWREREKFLNQYPQFKTNIQGLDIHFIHVKPKETKSLKVLPLLLLHGWCGSVREFYEIIPLLTSPQPGKGFVFEVIAPSLPGYGFSDPAVRPGLSASHMAVIFKNLMSRLGFEKYYVQGGDWGSIIGNILAVLYPSKVIGIHFNMCFVDTPLSHFKLLLASIYPTWFVKPEHVDLVFPLSKTFQTFMLEFGYMHIQATKPDTVGVALRDSPVGLAAYLLEKFSTWTNPANKDLDDGGLTKKYTLTSLLDNVMVYWVTRSITTSMRLYAESFNKKFREESWNKQPITVPTGCTRFRHELAFQPEFILKDKYQNLVQLEDYDDGGHFAAFEVPNVLSKDVYQFVEKVEKSINVKE